MLDDLAGKRTGERIQILRERKGLSRPVLAGLVGMSASWLKGIERGTRLPPRLPLLVKLAEALAVGDVAVLAGTDMDLGGATSVPVASFARIPHDAVPAIREAIRDPLLTVPAGPADVAALAARTADAWHLWHQSTQHRTDVGRILPRLVTDARIAARTAEGQDRRAANAVLADVYALVQHEVVWASEAELTWTAADRAMTAAQEADTPAALAGAAWTLGMVQRSAGRHRRRADARARRRRAARTAPGGRRRRDCARCTARCSCTPRPRRPGPGREGDAWRHWDTASATAGRLAGGYHHPWTMFGRSNVKLHAVSIAADLSKSAEARSHAEDIDPEEIPSRERRGRLGRRDRPLLPPAPRLPGHAALAGDGLPDLGRLGALLPDRPADDRRRRGPRRGADQPQGALAGRERRPAPVDRGRTLHPVPTGPHTGRVTACVLPIVAADGVIRATQGEDDMGRAAAASGISGQRDPFRVDEGRALAELELAWADGGYHGFSADGGTWCAISSAGDVLTGATPDALNRAIRAHWQAMQ